MKKTTKKITSQNIGLIIMRGQTLHYGHLNLITKALFENDELIIALGSRNKPISFENPFKVSQRIEMMKIVFGESSKIKLLTLADIGAVDKFQWAEYVFEEIDKNKMKQPNRYYAGDKDNYHWYEGVNNLDGIELEIHTIDRLKSGIMSATEIRKSIANGFDTWKDHVPECLHQYILDNFPKHYLLSEKLKH